MRRCTIFKKFLRIVFYLKMFPNLSIRSPGKGLNPANLETLLQPPIRCVCSDEQYVGPGLHLPDRTSCLLMIQRQCLS